MNCQQPYEPPAILANLNYLVVDGTIVSGPDSTIFNLSTTQNISDSGYTGSPVTGAQMSVIGQNGESYPLTEQTPGKYMVPSLSLNPSETYQLKILTTDGNQYLSDSVPVRQTPPIDSVSWTSDGTAVHVFVTTHDPTNQTRYYRWQFAETWEYNSNYKSYLVYTNGQIQNRTAAQDFYTCWATDLSSAVLTATSVNLGQDVIFEYPLLVDSIRSYTYPPDYPLVEPGVSQKFVREYSVLVYQYAITQDAYNYWLTLKQNTEQLGTIFAPQPSQLTGNIHCVNNPARVVLGFVGASTLQQQRIFINSSSLYNGSAASPQIGCGEWLVPPDSINYYFSQVYFYTPIDSVESATGVFEGINGTFTLCSDCTTHGGTIIKPSYWPN